MTAKAPVTGSQCINGKIVPTITELDENGNPVSGSEQSLPPSEGVNTGHYSPSPPSEVNLRADTAYKVELEKSAPGDTVNTVHYQFGEARPGYVFEYKKPGDTTWQSSSSNPTTPAFDLTGANDDFVGNILTFHFRFRKLPQTDEARIRGVSAGSINVQKHDTPAKPDGSPQTLILPSISDRIDFVGASTTYSAGHLLWELPVFGTTAPTPALIKYGRITGNGVDVKLDTNNDIKQLWTGSSSINGTLVTVTQVNANTLKILLFEDIAEPGQSGGFYTAPADNTADRSQIIRKLTTGNGGYEIETMQDGKTSVIAYIPVTTDQTWIVRTGDTATVTQEVERTVTFSLVSGIWNKTVITETKIGGQTISHVTETFEVRESPGELQISRVQQVGGGKPNLTTLWTHYLDASRYHEYGRVKTVTYPNGSWVKYEYIDGTLSGVDGTKGGLLQYKYEPWLDAVTDPNNASQTNCKVTQYEYVSGAGGTINKRISAIKEKILNHAFETKELRYSNSSSAFNTFHGYLAQQTGVSSSSIKYDRREIQTNTSPETTLTCYFPDNHAQWPGKVMGVARPDQTCESRNYERGDFNVGTGVFTVNASGTYIRETITHGNLTSPAGVANLTTRQISVRDDFDRLHRQETLIYNGSQYEQATVYTTTYVLNTDNSIQKKTVSQDGRIVSETEYISDTETHYTDEAGIKIVTVQDALDRTLTSTVKGKGGQVDRVTSYAYNGLTTVRTTSAGNLSLVASTTRDQVGQVVSETDQRGITVTWDHQNGGRTTVTSRPGGLSDTVDRHLDGRTKSRTGDTVVDVHYVHSAPSSTERLTRMEMGDGNMAPADIRWQEVSTHMSGRVLETRQPGPPDDQGNNPTVTRTYHYDATTGNVLRISSSAADTADVLFSYDAVSRRTLQGLDEDGNDVPDLAGTDRIVQTETSYHKEYNLWWRKVVTKTYQTNNSNTPTVLKTMLIRINANSNNRASDIRITNQAGNTDVLYTTIDRANATVYQTRDVFTSLHHESVTSVNGLVTQFTDDVSSTLQKYTYDALGREVSFTDALGSTTRTSYNSKGQVERTTDGLGNVTRYIYYPSNSVSAGLLKQTTDPEGSIIIRTYNNRGQLLTEYGTGTYSKGYGYNVYGEMSILSTYKNGGANPDADTTWHYDGPSGALVAKEYDNGKQTLYEYHANGRLKKRTWARLDNGQPLTTTYTWNILGDLTGKNYSDNTTTNLVLTPDRAGRTTGVTDAGGNSTITYNTNNGELDEISHASGHILGQSSIKYSYVSNEYLQKMTLKKSGVIRQEWFYHWDDKGRKTSIFNDISFAGGSSQLKFSYSYLQNTRRIKTISSELNASLYATSIREIDKLGRLSSITNKSAGGTILTRHGYKHDRASRRIEATLHDGSKWKYGYNFKGEVAFAKKYQVNNNVLAGHQFEYEFDGIGNRTKARYAGDGNGTLGREISYTSNSVNQYTAISTPPSISVTGRAPVASNISINTVSVLAANRQGEHFFGEATESANTVPNGKWKQIDITDGTNTVTGHRWMEPESLVPTHDDDGNLTNDGRWDYTWDAENRLTKMETTATARTVGAPWVVLEFVYDYMGRRISRKQTDKDSGGNPTATTEHHYRYNGWNCIARTNSGWTDAIYYTWGTDISETPQGAGGVGGLLGVRQEKNGTTHISSPCYDGNGNVVVYLDTSGNVITRYEYDPFGNLIRSGGAVNGEKELYLFSTKPVDPVSGFYYYNFRYYDPVTGRWRSRDPIEEEGGTNLYGFVENNAIDGVDVLGLESSEWDRLWEEAQRKAKEEARRINNPRRGDRSPSSGSKSSRRQPIGGVVIEPEIVDGDAEDWAKTMEDMGTLADLYKDSYEREMAKIGDWKEYKRINNFVINTSKLGYAPPSTTCGPSNEGQDLHLGNTFTLDIVPKIEPGAIVDRESLGTRRIVPWGVVLHVTVDMRQRHKVFQITHQIRATCLCIEDVWRWEHYTKEAGMELIGTIDVFYKR